jgi:hypothetical protein
MNKEIRYSHVVPMDALIWYGASLGGPTCLKHNILRLSLISESCIEYSDSTQTKTFYITLTIMIKYYISQPI